MKPEYNDTFLIQIGLKSLGFDPGVIDGLPGRKTDIAYTAWLDSMRPKTAPSVEVSDRGIALIKHFESCLKPLGDGRFTSYADPGYGWELATIGWGTVKYPNGNNVHKGDIITQAQADEYFVWEVNEKAIGVAELLKVPVNLDQFAALVSFSYNVGLGALKGSTLLKYLNQGDYSAASGEFLKWNKSNGQVLRGLTRRRESERNLFLGKTPFIVES